MSWQGRYISDLFTLLRLFVSVGEILGVWRILLRWSCECGSERRWCECDQLTDLLYVADVLQNS